MKVKVPVKVPRLKGASLRNFAICVPGSNTKLLCGKSFPPVSVKLNEIVTCAPVGFTKAMPVLAGPPTSA